MPGPPAIDPATATGRTKRMFDGLLGKLGMVPNLMRGLANSPALLKGYLGLNGALAGGSLGTQDSFNILAESRVGFPRAEPLPSAARAAA